MNAYTHFVQVLLAVTALSMSTNTNEIQMPSILYTPKCWWHGAEQLGYIWATLTGWFWLRQAGRLADKRSNIQRYYRRRRKRSDKNQHWKCVKHRRRRKLLWISCNWDQKCSRNGKNTAY